MSFDIQHSSQMDARVKAASLGIYTSPQQELDHSTPEVPPVKGESDNWESVGRQGLEIEKSQLLIKHITQNLPKDTSDNPESAAGRPELEIGRSQQLTEASMISEDSALNFTTHAVGKDSWLQVGLVLITGIDNAFILSYPKIVMSYLGWSGGVIALLLGAVLSLDASILLAKLHFIGGKRLIRLRDLAGHVYGRKMFIITWISQYVNLFIGNTGVIILAGSALKGIYVQYNNSSDLKLPHWIAITGATFVIFTFFVPQLSDLRFWLGVASALTAVYVTIVLVLSFRDGYRHPPRDYGVHGTQPQKVFNIISAFANIAFAFNTGILPEIQATARAPAVLNMKKALYLQFTAGSAIFYSVMLVGYWAYGSSVSGYILADVSGSKTVITIANVAVILQTLVSLTVYVSPMFEYLDTRLAVGKDESMWSLKNMAFRLATRTSYFAFNAFIAALMPFLGDFVSLTGALSIFPFTFVMGHHIYLKIKWKELNLLQKSWHWASVTFYCLLTVSSIVAAVRNIVVDSTTYHFFADV